MVSPVDAGVRRFRGHCYRIHRISTELEWSQRVQEFGHCRARRRALPDWDSRHREANTNAAAGPARRRRDVDDARPNSDANFESAPEGDAHPQGDAQREDEARAEAEGDAHPQAEGDAHTQGEAPSHTHAEGHTDTEAEAGVPAGPAAGRRPRRARRGCRPKLRRSLKVEGLPYEPLS